MIHEQWARKDVKESGQALFETESQHFPKGTERKHKILRTAGIGAKIYT
jgi:hypothetical protein